jgi:conjugative relaxase-like TrwC/TraI family protein
VRESFRDDPVLSLGKLAAGQAQYYLDTVAAGAEEYYVGGREAPGQWCGRSAELLGLTGEVDGEQLHRLLRHLHPVTGERLTAARSVPTVVGFDATFSAPKSVSLLFALGDPETSNEVRNAHDVAVAEALRVYEEISAGRRGKGGLRSVEGDGFVAAGFRHRTSRNADPQLHTHAVIANVVHAQADDRWTALDGRPLYGWARPVGFLYEAQLRWELTRRLGVTWTPIKNGIGDIVGFSPKVLKAFSTRRAEIDERLAILGQEGSKATQDAVYKTRKPKDPNLDVGDLAGEWRERAASQGLDDAALAAALHRVADAPPLDVAAVFASLSAPDGLTEKRSTFGRKEVIQGVCNALTSGGHVDDVLELVDAYLTSEHVVGLDATATPTLRVGGGRLVPGGAAEQQWTTPDMIALEQRLLAQTAARQHEGAGVAEPGALAGSLARRTTLTDEQRRMVEQLCRSGAGVDVIEGVAGAGKTYALAAARDAWEASGHRVIGASLAARTAARLEQGSGIPSTSLDRLLHRVERDDPLTDRDVVVIDEAAMVGTRKLMRLLDHAAAARAKVVLIGDPRQLPEIEAGGAFASLSNRFGDATLTKNRRQIEPWERDALAALRAGDIDQALGAYEAHGRIHQPDDARAQLVEDWWNARQQGERGLMVAPRLREVDDLNRRARQLLRGHGLLGAEEIVLGGRAFAVGDEVLALRNDYRAQILNGTAGTVAAIDVRGGVLRVESEGRAITLPFRYAEDGDLTHGYSTTLHKAQGATVDRTFVLADETYAREHMYTAMSRGTIRNDLYITDIDDRSEVRHAPELTPDAVDGLTRTAARSAAQRLAIDVAGDRLVPLPALESERYRLVRALSEGPPDPTIELREVQRKIADQRASLDEAERRRDSAASSLDAMGPVGRRIHRRERDRYQHNRDNADRDIDRAGRKLADLADEANRLTAAVPTRRAWERARAPELERLRDLTSTIVDRRLEATVERARTVEHEVDLGISL